MSSMTTTAAGSAHVAVLDAAPAASVAVEHLADGCSLRGDVPCRGRLTTPDGEIRTFDVAG
jgi:hypothetical protein